MANKPLNTAILDRAIIFAVRAHTSTERRGKGFPYIVHPMEAVEIVATMTKDQELLAAAVLHDTLQNPEIQSAYSYAQSTGKSLHIMGLQQPQEMTGQCLISQSCKNLNFLQLRLSKFTIRLSKFTKFVARVSKFTKSVSKFTKFAIRGLKTFFI